MVATTARPAPATAQQILDTALALASSGGWDNLRLYQVAAAMGLSLHEVQAHYRDLDALANAWFNRALRAMLAPPETTGEAPAKRLQKAMERWFDALADYRRVSLQMLGGKLYLAHVHHWGPLVFDLSRLIHWWLDAAAIASTGRQRQVAEIGLTAIFLATLVYWSRDESPGQARTKRFLARRLRAAERCMNHWFAAGQNSPRLGQRGEA